MSALKDGQKAAHGSAAFVGDLAKQWGYQQTWRVNRVWLNVDTGEREETRITKAGVALFLHELSPVINHDERRQQTEDRRALLASWRLSYTLYAAGRREWREPADPLPEVGSKWFRDLDDTEVEVESVSDSHVTYVLDDGMRVERTLADFRKRFTRDPKNRAANKRLAALDAVADRAVGPCGSQSPRHTTRSLPSLTCKLPSGHEGDCRSGSVAWAQKREGT
jgi:hypothetical protein